MTESLTKTILSFTTLGIEKAHCDTITPTIAGRKTTPATDNSFRFSERSPAV